MSVEVPKVCRAAKVQNPGPDYKIVLVEDYPVPSPKRGEILLKLDHTGLCMSDHHAMKQDLGNPMGCDCSGHEGAGRVVAVGEGVDDWKIGDRGGIKPIYDTCHQCSYCREGMETHCEKVCPTGVAVNGTYTQYCISPARYTTRIPDNVPNEFAAPLQCSGATMYTAIKNGRVRAGQWLCIPGGGGGVGHWGVLFGRAMGLRVLVIDSGEDKKKMCEEMGAEKFIDYKTVDNMTAAVHKATGGVHCVIVTGGTAGAYKDAATYMRRGGVMVCVGLPAYGTAVAGMDPVLAIFRKLTITGSLTSNMADTDEAMDFVARGLVKPRVEVRPWDQFIKSFDDLVASRVAGRIVMDFNL